MASLPSNTPLAEVAAWNDYRSSLWQAFQNNYEDRWDQGMGTRMILLQHMLDQSLACKQQNGMQQSVRAAQSKW